MISPLFDRFEKMLEKEKMLVSSIFSAPHNVLILYSFWHINNSQILKTCWEKEKLLMMSNFSFSHNVFYSIRKLYPQ